MTTTIEKQDFEEYKKLEKSGVVDMDDTLRVFSLTNLTRKQVQKINSNYKKFDQKFEAEV